MTDGHPPIRVLKHPPKALGVAPVRKGILAAAAGPIDLGHGTVTLGNADRVAPIERPQFEPGSDVEEGDGRVLVPEEPTRAMVEAGIKTLDLQITLDKPDDAPDLHEWAIMVYRTMLAARNDPDPQTLDTKALFDAEPDEIRKALALYRKMTAPRKRKQRKPA